MKPSTSLRVNEIKVIPKRHLRKDRVGSGGTEFCDGSRVVGAMSDPAGERSHCRENREELFKKHRVGMPLEIFAV
jgi:hypothetical protein